MVKLQNTLINSYIAGSSKLFKVETIKNLD